MIKIFFTYFLMKQFSCIVRWDWHYNSFWVWLLFPCGPIFFLLSRSVTINALMGFKKNRLDRNYMNDTLLQIRLQGEKKNPSIVTHECWILIIYINPLRTATWIAASAVCGWIFVCRDGYKVSKRDRITRSAENL